MSTLQIGLGIATSPGPDIDPIAEAIAAERLGFDFVSASDHLHGENPTYEPWTLLTTVAARTTSVRVLTRVLAIPYRNPAVLAKMAETLDRLSDGRLLLGLGAGYLDEEFRALGLPASSLRDKIDGMAEAIELIRGLWSTPDLSYAGRLHRTDHARLEPRPDQPIPIWLGTYGPRALAITGRLADGWIPSFGFAPPDKVGALRDQVVAAAEEAGRDPGEITMAYNLLVRVEAHPAAAGAPSPSVISGSGESIAEQLLGFTKLGFNAFNLVPGGPDRLGQVERLGTEVLPGLRGALVRA